MDGRVDEEGALDAEDGGGGGDVGGVWVVAWVGHCLLLGYQGVKVRVGGKDRNVLQL